MQINTLPVYSKLAEASEVPPEVAEKLPKGWRLYQHQLETYKALVGDDYDVIFNTALTGDGKSLAAYLPVLIDSNFHTFGMYPTNELVRDQGRQFDGYIQAFSRSLPYCSLWGAELTRLVEQYNFRYRGDALNERFANNNVILTNPDIFNLVMNYHAGYKSRIFSEQELPYSLCTNFDYFVFDEFHVFEVPQIVSTLTAISYIHTYSHNMGNHKILFSSATPNETMIELIEGSGLKYKIIKGSYKSVECHGYSLVLHPALLDIVKLQEKQTVEDWMRQNLGQLIAFWDGQWPRPKAAVIVNSVVAARRIAKMLDEELMKFGISVSENTGLTDSERRKISLQKDVVVGTSTIDVGVDFNINLLIYESTNAGSFLQRLGRLGRNKWGQPGFERYQAFALISGNTPWIYERIVKGMEEQGIDKCGIADRPDQLNRIIRSAFPFENEFNQYRKRWGILQAAHIIDILDNNRNQGVYDNLIDDLSKMYQKIFNVSDLTKARKRYWHLIKKENKPIIDEVIAFRGSSPFLIGIWDTTTQPHTFLAYDLLTLIQNADYEVVSYGAFKQALSERYKDDNQYRDALAGIKNTIKGKNELPLILKITQFKAEREWLKLKVRADLSILSDHVFVMRGVTIIEPMSPQLPAVNEVIKYQTVVCYATRRDSRDVRRMLLLPTHFPLFVGQDIHRNRDYTLAFGKAALKLESQFLFSQKIVENDPIIF